uniref:Uncharacterized protein n=1 Tax=Arundo donax TaxID=35708 RepID=A0A0A9FMR3_ARUDO
MAGFVGIIVLVDTHMHTRVYIYRFPDMCRMSVVS